jgi:type IV secretion system protein VirB10
LVVDNGPAISGQTAIAGNLSGDEAFSARVGASSPEIAAATRMKTPGYTVSQGTLIPAVLETAINSDLPGYVRAVVSDDVKSFDGSRVLVPRSSRLIGQYKSGVAGGQTRAYVLWTRLLRPDGVSVALASPAVDEYGQTGLTGSVDDHFMKRFGSALLLSVVGTASAFTTGGTSLVLSGGESAASVAARRDGQIPPTIKVRQGQPIRVFTAKDLDFSVLSGERR